MIVVIVMIDCLIFIWVRFCHSKKVKKLQFWQMEKTQSEARRLQQRSSLHLAMSFWVT